MVMPVSADWLQNDRGMEQTRYVLCVNFKSIQVEKFSVHAEHG